MQPLVTELQPYRTAAVSRRISARGEPNEWTVYTPQSLRRGAHRPTPPPSGRGACTRRGAALSPALDPLSIGYVGRRGAGATEPRSLRTRTTLLAAGYENWLTSA